MNSNKERREWRVTNAAAVTAGSRWYPLAETGAPTDREYVEQFPLRQYSFENISDNQTTLILDPQPLNSGKRWTVPAQKTRESDPTERITFHSAHVVNDGADDIAIGELAMTLRNY